MKIVCAGARDNMDMTERVTVVPQAVTGPQTRRYMSSAASFRSISRD